MKQITNQRIFYCIAFILLLGIEILIALYADDRFIRPYLGDVLVVVVIYCLIRIAIPNRGKLVPLWIFVFAVMVETLQGMGLVYKLGLAHYTFFRILIGSVFDWKDIACYGVGCMALLIYEWLINKKQKQLTH